MTESLDALVERILHNGWVFQVEPTDVLHRQLTNGERLVAVAYEATVISPKGESNWESAIPAEALAVALGAVERMNWGTK